MVLLKTPSVKSQVLTTVDHKQSFFRRVGVVEHVRGIVGIHVSVKQHAQKHSSLAEQKRITMENVLHAVKECSEQYAGLQAAQVFPSSCLTFLPFSCFLNLACTLLLLTSSKRILLFRRILCSDTSKSRLLV